MKEELPQAPQLLPSVAVATSPQPPRPGNFSSKRGRILETLLMEGGTTSNPQASSCLESLACFDHVSEDTYNFSWN